MSAKDRMPSSAQVLARVMMRKALVGNQSAIEAVLDRIEGKPGKSAPNKSSDGHIEEQLNESLASLDELTK